MSKEKKQRDKAAEKAVKERIQKTHLKSMKVLGSRPTDEERTSAVYLLRIVGCDNYLFKINAQRGYGGGYTLSGLIPVNDRDEFGDYSVYNPKKASADALKPTDVERKKFKGYK